MDDLPDDPFDAGTNTVDGSGTVADYVQLTGGSGSPAVTNQTPYDVVDNGLLSSNATTTASGVTTGTSTSAMPSWLTAITQLGTAVTGTATTVAPLINGKPVTSPANPGAQPVAGTIAALTSSISSLLPLILIGLVAWFFLGRKNRA